ncbi:hypothetical protein GTP56_17200 [Duganella sp. FT134W]|uniref:histidine kinase n=1 Tax=Duganella margarita TaxID=2692170 RepID=A0A7X4KIV4_9BURK|nr:ATP-binding protein [Duganella margarita]MYM73928.1 hypothetical protein [Duganella margarita]
MSAIETIFRDTRAPGDCSPAALNMNLLAGIAHDVRGPLTIICGLAKTLSELLPEPSAEQAEILARLQSEALQTGALLNCLLDLLRMTHAAPIVKQEWQSMEEVIGTAVRIGARYLEGFQLTIDIADGFPLLRFDPILIERVLVNLLENAAKYTPSGSRISIVATFDAKEAYVIVQDDGPGLPHGWEHQQFKAFRRGPATGGITGTGLGLAICQSMLAVSGGRFFVCRSALGGAGLALALPVETPPVVDLET